MPRVSVIVPSYNSGRYLGAALESVLQQTYADFEVVILDDGSTDSTGSIAASFEKRFAGKLRYFYQTNRGLPAARNEAIRRSSGDLIALLDADDLWMGHRLERSVAALDADPDAGLAHAKVGRIDANGRRLPDPPHPADRYLAGRIAHHIYTRRAHLLCPTILFRRQCLDQGGWFDESMGATEDRDLWFRIARRYSVAYVDEILALYRLSATSMSANRERMLKWQLHFIHKHHQLGNCNLFQVRQALANLCRERGDTFFREGDLRRSLNCYSQAVLHNPLNLPNLYMLLRALGEPVLSSIGIATRFARGTSS